MTGIFTLNGESRRLEAATVIELLRQESLDPTRRGLAVARNGAVVPRDAWPETPVRPGDQIEIVKPFSGG